MILLWKSLFSSTRLIFLKYHFPHMRKSFSNFFWLSKLIQISQPGNLGYSMVVQLFQTKIFCSSWNSHFSPNLPSYSCLEHLNHKEFQRKSLHKPLRALPACSINFSSSDLCWSLTLSSSRDTKWLLSRPVPGVTGRSKHRILTESSTEHFPFLRQRRLNVKFYEWRLQFSNI